jgi:hypothetical protein
MYLPSRTAIAERGRLPPGRRPRSGGGPGRPEGPAARAAGRAARRRARAARGRARPRQVAGRAVPGPSARRPTFRRIQFTPDLLPADLIGTQVYNPKHRRVVGARGAGLRQLRARRRDQPRAGQGAVGAARGDAGAAGDARGDETHRCRRPFLVLATQNPVEQEGTYPLPEAQVDRFMLKLVVGYPSKDDEDVIVERMATGTAPPRSARWLARADPRRARVLDDVYVDEMVRATWSTSSLLRVTPRPRGSRAGWADPLRRPRRALRSRWCRRRARMRSSKAAATSRRRTSRRSAWTCCATA